ncbi:MAG: diguanylate cyclase [Actinobacteria bacterium]|nr:diguanylate cyclase [Actinomycetota bacterium]
MAEPAPDIIHLDGHPPAGILLGAMDALPQALAVVDREARIVATNRAWRRLVTPEDHVVGVCEGGDLLAHLRTARPAHAAVADHVADGMRRVLASRTETFELQYEVDTSDGVRWYLLTIGAMPGGGAVVTRQDTTVHHSVQDLLAELAFHDPLTGLPNRMLVVDRLRLSMLRGSRTGERPAVVFFDLDGFKRVNDRFGHEVGDQLLVQVAQRLRHHVRDGDTCGRWGGDEFVVVVELADLAAVDGLVRRTLEVFEQPFLLGDVEVSVGASIGVVVVHADERAESVMRRADEAMYTAKRSHRPVWIAPDVLVRN